MQLLFIFKRILLTASMVGGRKWVALQWSLRMDKQIEAFTMFLVVTVVFTLIPIVPAWLTYRITPNQTIGLKGPLQGLTVRATGAFAAYLIVLMIIVYSILPNAVGSI